MRLAQDSLEVALFTPLRTGSLIFRRYDLDPSATFESFENIVYDNPLLLSESFRSVDIIIADAPYMLLPAMLSDSEMAELWDAAADSEWTSDKVDLVDAPSGCETATIVTAVQKRLAAFVKRTFAKATLHHRLESLCRYFMGLSSRGNGRKLFINFNESGIDVVAAHRNQLLLANSFKCKTADDAAYFALACRSTLRLDHPTDIVMVSGDSPLREAATTTIRQFTPNVMPVIFPTAMLKSGPDAPRASFDLIIFPLRKQCE